MAKMNIKKGDKVVVIAGKNKGKEGEVLRTVPETSRVVVQDVNMIKKAMKPSQQNPQGGISSFEAPIHVSNVMLICPECKKPTRVGRTRVAHPNKDGKTIGVRVCKKCNAQIDKVGK